DGAGRILADSGGSARAVRFSTPEGVDLAGYRVGGRWVVTGWVWIPEFGVGVGAQLEKDHAYQTVYRVRAWFIALFALLVATGTVVVILAPRHQRQSRELHLSLARFRAATEASPFGIVLADL